MAKVMIKCPETCHAISTAVKVDTDAAFDSLLNVAYHVDCPLCGNNHTWFKHDAWIAGPPNLGEKTFCAARRRQWVNHRRSRRLWSASSLLSGCEPIGRQW